MQDAKAKRKWTRFETDPGSAAGIQVGDFNHPYKPTHNALCVNESFRGSCLLVTHISGMNIGELVWAKVGDMEPLKGEIRWIEKLEDHIFKIGLFWVD